LSPLYIGIMTGTSLDGLDAVLADFSTAKPSILASAALDYPADLRAEMLALQGANDAQGTNELHRSRVAAIDLATLHAQAVQALLHRARLPASAIAAIGAHGQTVRHAPNSGAHSYTVQLLDAARLLEHSRITVVTDFRARDIAAGGQGAPLVPAFHAAQCAGQSQATVLVNIGGFANATLIQASGAISGLDTGPGNVLMDAWTQRHQGKPYDASGAWAASSAPNEALLARLLQHPYFAQALPKSTGREAFNLAWLDAQLALFPHLDAAQVQATLCALTARSIAAAIAPHGAQTLYACGGGAYNATLMQALQTALPNCAVQTTDALGVAPEHMEALAFAWLARQCLLGLAGNVPAVTGARGARVLGAVYAV
jgi:anhydro-N-acetylmuramic acid kinase